MNKNKVRGERNYDDKMKYMTWFPFYTIILVVFYAQTIFMIEIISKRRARCLWICSIRFVILLYRIMNTWKELQLISKFWYISQHFHFFLIFLLAVVIIIIIYFSYTYLYLSFAVSPLLIWTTLSAVFHFFFFLSSLFWHKFQYTSSTKLQYIRAYKTCKS